MKKIICTALVSVMLLGCVLAFAACGGVDVPDGYTLYENNNDISFAYPEDWTVQEGSVVVIKSKTGNNITLAYEPKTDMYDDMTVSTFNTTLKPMLENAGMSVSEVSVEHKTTNGLDVVEISYKAKMSGQTMDQTLFVVTVGERTYSISVTEVTADSELVQNVFNTISEK